MRCDEYEVSKYDIWLELCAARALIHVKCLQYDVLVVSDVVRHTCGPPSQVRLSEHKESDTGLQARSHAAQRHRIALLLGTYRFLYQRRCSVIALTVGLRCVVSSGGGARLQSLRKEDCLCRVLGNAHTSTKYENSCISPGLALHSETCSQFNTAGARSLHVKHLRWRSNS